MIQFLKSCKQKLNQEQKNAVEGYVNEMEYLFSFKPLRKTEYLQTLHKIFNAFIFLKHTCEF